MGYKALQHMTYQEYLKTDHWKTVSWAAKWHAGFACQICGSEKNLQVHHRDYDSLYNERPEDVTVLCSRCHEAIEISMIEG